MNFSFYLKIPVNNMFLMAVLHSGDNLKQTKKKIQCLRKTITVRNDGIKKLSQQIITCRNLALASFSFILPCATR